MEIDGYVTTRQAAQMLGISYQRVRLLIANGELASEKIGNTRLVSVAAIEERVKRNPVGGWPKGKPRKSKDL